MGLHALLIMIRLICFCDVKVDDGVNCFKALTRDSRAVAAGGGLEIAVSRELREFGTRQAGLQQYSICAFADALESIPRTLAENSGLDAQVPPLMSTTTCLNAVMSHFIEVFGSSTMKVSQARL